MNRDQVDKLALEGTYKGTPLHGEVIETHISWVIVSKDYAFKIKKPVKLSFLDFSTIALRKKYCMRELELNRKWSDIYLNVAPIGYGQAKVIDYAVVMKRLEENLRMDRQLVKNKVTGGQIRSLAKKIASVHARSKIIRRPFSLRYTQQLFNDLQLPALKMKKLVGQRSIKMIDQAVQWSDQFLKQHRARFSQRIEEGFQRDVHGDLHSANIFLDTNPVIFDCLEFNNRYRQIDLLYEAAFLAMDIEAFGQSDLAEQFIRDYTKAMPCMTSDEDHEILFYYKCLRANVRAKVHLIQAGQLSDEARVKSHIKQAQRYLALMQQYMEET